MTKILMITLLAIALVAVSRSEDNGVINATEKETLSERLTETFPVYNTGVFAPLQLPLLGHDGAGCGCPDGESDMVTDPADMMIAVLLLSDDGPKRIDVFDGSSRNSNEVLADKGGSYGANVFYDDKTVVDMYDDGLIEQTQVKIDTKHDAKDSGDNDDDAHRMRVEMHDESMDTLVGEWSYIIPDRFNQDGLTDTDKDDIFAIPPDDEDDEISTYYDKTINYSEAPSYLPSSQPYNDSTNSTLSSNDTVIISPSPHPKPKPIPKPEPILPPPLDHEVTGNTLTIMFYNP